MGQRLLVAGLFLPLLLLAVVPAQLAGPAEASPNPLPQMSMSFDHSGITVHPTFSQYGTATAWGTLSIDKIPGERFVVLLSGSIDTGWGVGISPSLLAFQNNIKVVGFQVTVSCPPGTPTSLVGDLRIEAHGKGTTFEPMVVGHVVVTVAPFYMIRIDSPNPYKEVTPGSKLDFLVELRNFGNSMDSYDIYIENQEELTGMGWTVSFSTPVVTKVRAGDGKFARLSVMAPQRSTIYKAEGSVINVRAVSQNARAEGNQIDMVYPFVVYERGTFIDPFATGWAALVLAVILIPLVYALRRTRRWYKGYKARKRAEEDAYYDEGYEDEEEYEEDGYDDDEDYEDEEDEGPPRRWPWSRRSEP